MKRINLMLIALGILISVTANAQSGDVAAILDLLNKQTKAWNNGQIEKFMEGYWQSDSLMFIGKSGVTYGWQKTLDNYKKGYPDTAAMGKLDFNLLQFKSLSPTCYFVVGKWHLARSIGEVGGVFTLLFRKIKKKWVIIADHSS
ncbi:MAG: DUF4440 domain-containing protein [Chitinophagaceae bacterium]|nr:DUF4440 domain-containing protein [Chitinophagaceae bacterium]